MRSPRAIQRVAIDTRRRAQPRRSARIAPNATYFGVFEVYCEAGVRTGGDRKLEAQHSREKRQETAMHISTLLWNIMTCGTFSRLFCCDLSSVERALDRRNSGINPSTVKHLARHAGSGPEIPCFARCYIMPLGHIVFLVAAQTDRLSFFLLCWCGGVLFPVACPLALSLRRPNPATWRG